MFDGHGDGDDDDGDGNGDDEIFDKKKIGDFLSPWIFA